MNKQLSSLFLLLLVYLAINAESVGENGIENLTDDAEDDEEDTAEESSAVGTNALRFAKTKDKDPEDQEDSTTKPIPISEVSVSTTVHPEVLNADANETAVTNDTLKPPNLNMSHTPFIKSRVQEKREANMKDVATTLIKVTASSSKKKFCFLLFAVPVLLFVLEECL